MAVFQQLNALKFNVDTASACPSGMNETHEKENNLFTIIHDAMALLCCIFTLFYHRITDAYRMLSKK